MRKWAKFALAISVVAVVGVLVWQSLRQREPFYEGRSLRAWLIDFNTSFPWLPGQDAEKNLRAGEAIRRIGTNALPFLVEMARAKDSSLSSLIGSLAMKQNLIRARFWTENDEHQLAASGFQALGQTGAEAVPSLVALLHDPDLLLRLNAAGCLGNIGPDAKAAIPALLPLLNNKSRMVAWDTTLNLGKIHMEPDLVVPALIEKLGALEASSYRGTVMSALGRFGKLATPAIPAILPFLHDADNNIRTEATNALKAIDAEAAAKAGVK